MTDTRSSSGIEELRRAERSLFEAADKAYFKACETSDPQHWLEAGLLARQHRNALTKLNGVAQRQPEPGMREALEQIDRMPFSMVNDADSLRHTIKTIQAISRKALAIPSTMRTCPDCGKREACDDECPDAPLPSQDRGAET